MKNVSTLLQLPTVVWSEDVDLYNDDNCCDSLVTYCQHLRWKFWYVCVWHHERLLLLFALLLNPYQQEYVNQVSRFKLEAAIQEELGSFLRGFWKVSLNNRLFCYAKSSKFEYNRPLLFIHKHASLYTCMHMWSHFLSFTPIGYSPKVYAGVHTKWVLPHSVWSA